ncbi:MAG TPA: hypothetical protein VHC47_13450 [Mucilaginibacter sp.]|nr:hypothetical protein [Mucilaginibacter sp.]
MMVKLSLTDQSVFHSFDPAIFYQVPNKVGTEWRNFGGLSKVSPDMLEDTIHTAWEIANFKTACKRKG